MHETTHPAKRDWSLDRVLAVLGIVVGIILYLVPQKTPAVVIGVVALIFALLIHPLCNLPWVEKRHWRKVLTALLFIFLLGRLADISWPAQSGRVPQAIVHPLYGLWTWGSEQEFDGAPILCCLSDLLKFDEFGSW